VFITVEIIYTKQFRTYTYKLAVTQDLGRIMFDETHLIITASDYRQAMVDLALVRNIRMQFVYLTATLLPIIQVMFEK
jgi:hypothetical protein